MEKRTGYIEKRLISIVVRFTQLTNETLLALLSLNRALTYLNIQSTMFRGWQHRLCDIMNACPNLMAISFSSYGLDMTGAAMEYPNIIKLHIDSFMDKDTLSSILRRFPNLKCLRLGHVLYSGVLTDIQQHCPLLQQLFVSAQYGGYADTATIVDGHEKGLRVLHLSGGERRQLAVQGRNMDWKRRQVFSENDVVRFIMQHSETLETITIDCEYGLAAPSTLLKRAATQQVTFKRLREIRYPFNSHKGLVSFLLWIIRHAPHLESVETVYGTLQAPVMQELLGPTHQQHLKKIGLLVDGSDQANEEQQFIQHHLQLDQQSNLKEIALKLDLHDVSSNSWILLIPQLAHLTHLEIRCDKWHMMNHVVSPFITEIVASQCLALERFTLSSPTLSIAYDHISGISSHTNLKVLTLNATNLDGDARSFVRCCQHIQSLHLILDTFDWDDINTLKTGTFKLLYTQRSGSYTHSILKKIHQ